MYARSARRVTSMVLLALGLALVGGGVSAAPASAWQGPMPVPVGAPGSTIANSTNSTSMTASSYNKLLMKNPKMVPLTVKAQGFNKVGGTLKGGAGFYTQAFMVGTTLGSNFSQWVGLDSSGDFMCDVQAAFTTQGCAQVPSPEYNPNSDISISPAGWSGSNQASVGYANPPNPGQFYPTPTAIVGGTGLFTGATTITGRAQLIGTYGQNFGLGQIFLVVHTATVSPTGVLSNLRSTNQSIIMWGGLSVPGEVSQSYNFGARPDGTSVLTKVELLDGPWGIGHVVGTWFPTGAPEYPAEPETNPVRSWRVDFKCSSGKIGSASSASFRETDPEWAPMPAAECDAGSILQSATMWQVTEGGEPKVVWSYEIPPEVAANTACLESGACQLDLEKKLPSGRTLSCFSDPDACTDWSEDPNKEKVYQCRYNGLPILLDECKVYVPTFNTDRPVDVDYAHPTTGEVPPSPVPTTPTVGDPQRATECFPSGWGIFNPAEWVYKPITCALQWAFVPRAGVVQDAFGGLQVALKTHAPFSVIVAIPGIVGSLGHGFNGGCAAMPDFSAIKGLHLQLPCEPPNSAAWRAAYTLQTIILWTTVAISAWHMVSRSIGGKE